MSLYTAAESLTSIVGGFRRSLREALQAELGVPVIVANLLVARVVAELLGA